MNDGEFFMSIDDFHKYVKYTFINRNTDDLTRTTFLKLNDNTKNSPGKYTRICGTKCTRHIFVMRSDVTQKVIVKAQTWEKYGMPHSCRK